MMNKKRLVKPSNPAPKKSAPVRKQVSADDQPNRPQVRKRLVKQSDKQLDKQPDKAIPDAPRAWPSVGRKHKWKTSTLDAEEGVIRVPASLVPDTFPSLSASSPPDTFYRVNKTTGDMAGLVTRMPDDVFVAWSYCGACGSAVELCGCKGGIIAPRSVEWIYVTTLVRSEGTRLEHPIDATHWDITKRGLYWYRPKSGSGRTYTPLDRPVIKPQQSVPQKPAQKPARLAKPGKPVAPEPELDLGKLGETAKSKSASAVDRLTKAMESKPAKKNAPKPKRLRKDT